MRILAAALFSAVVPFLAMAEDLTPTQQKQFFETRHLLSALQNEITDAAMGFSLLSQLDEGKIEEAKASLNLSLDSDILVIHALLQHCPSEETERLAYRFLARVAEHRSKHTSTTDPKNEKAMPEDARSQVESILQEAVKKDKVLTEAINKKQNKEIQPTN